MRRAFSFFMSIMITASVFTGCGAVDNAEDITEDSQIVTEETEDNTNLDVADEAQSVEVEEYQEPEGIVTSGPGAVYDGTLYYAVAGGGCHTGIIARDLSTGVETEIVSNEGTNGFSSLSVYKGYIYCVWDKYIGTDDSQCQIYRFSLEDYQGEYLTDGLNPLVANNTLYYWTSVYEIHKDGDYEYSTLHKFDLESLEEIEKTKLQHVTFGIEDGYIYQYMSSSFYLDGEVIAAIQYEELGEYDETYGYLWNEDAERGIRFYDIDGNEKDINSYDVKYFDYDSDGSPYGVDAIYAYYKVMGGGELVNGLSGENQVLNYVSDDGSIVTLQTWMPAE